MSFCRNKCAVRITGKNANQQQAHETVLQKQISAWFAFALLSGLPTAGLLPAQEAHGSILDRVADPRAGVLPGATIDVTSKAMGARASLVTNDQGFCQAMFCHPACISLKSTSTFISP
jgi:hypothetical protein